MYTCFTKQINLCYNICIIVIKGVRINTMNELDGIIQSINNYSNDLAYNVIEHLWFVRGLEKIAYYLSVFCQSQITWVFILIFIFWSIKGE